MTIQDFITTNLELCEKATEGEWKYEVVHQYNNGHEKYMYIKGGKIIVEGINIHPNMMLIAASRLALPRALKAIERLMAEIRLSTDRAFIEHCEEKVAEILRLRGNDE